ncbi:MAG: ArsA-related P-loop ATPase [Actinomycetia bacterium]|nr:ArsA-related P-loop ATPase [Actinomycetes bacterium]
MASSGSSGTFAQTRLHVVTGKGGTGKTTVAAALATALARQGKRVLIAEVEGRQGISQTFDVPPLSSTETRIFADQSGGSVYGLSVDAKDALLEYLQIFYKLGRAGSILERVGAIDFATTIAPGVRDVLLIGKIYEAAGRRDKGRRKGELVYDAIVLDAPPTGRIVRFLNVNHEVAGVARMGPIKAQADSITRMVRHHTTSVHLVTLLEEMPVQETIDAIGELREAQLNVGAILVNQVRDPLLTDDELAAISAGSVADRNEVLESVQADLKAAGVKATKVMVRGLFSQAHDLAERVQLQAQEDAVLAEQGLPLAHLPSLPGGVPDGGLRVLADTLTEAGII